MLHFSRSVVAVVIAVLLVKLFPAMALGADPHTVNLLPLIDVEKDAVGGTWKLENGIIESDASLNARLRIPYQPPEEYDFCMEFTRNSGNDEVVQILQDSGHSFTWQMGGWGSTICGFSRIDGKDANNKKNPSRFEGHPVLVNGRKYTSLIKVRRGSVVASIDGRVVSRCVSDPSGFRDFPGFSLGSDGLGIGTQKSPTTFNAITVIEISGPGKLSPRGGDNVAEKKPGQPKEDSQLHADATEDHKAISGPTTRVSNPSTTIKALEVYILDSGMILGRTSEAVLTVTRGDTPKETSVEFVTPVGEEMRLARDEAMRYIRIAYPNWNADAAEITFEDKYTAHDGGSIGTAIATMVLSAIQGFQIDPNIAVTGDISANGKVRAIGGVSAKIRGAIASNCTLVAIPMENQGQLVDAVTYSGPSLLSDIQVIGISNMDDAVATVRTDRDAKLAQAISLFSEIQLNIKNVPSYLQKKPEAREKLAQVMALCPRHLSAKVLLDVITGKQPKTLSATATTYYTSLAVANVAAVLNQRDKWQDPQLVPSGVVRIGLADLRKLTPLADPNVKPLVLAWMRFLEAWNDLQQGEGSGRELETRGQVLTDEMTREDTNADLMQKTLKEGF